MSGKSSQQGKLSQKGELLPISKLSPSNQTWWWLRYFFFIWVLFQDLSFFSRTLNHRTAREGAGHFINSSLPLPPVSQTIRHQPGDYCTELTTAHREQPDSKQEPLLSERKSLTTKLRALICYVMLRFLNFDWA